MADAAWKVVCKLAETWCPEPCKWREGCGCADEIERALNAEREACAVAVEKFIIPGHSVQAPSIIAASQAVMDRIDKSV